MNYNNETEVLSTLRNSKSAIIQYFTSFQNNCETQLRTEVREMFDVLESDGCSYIDHGYEGDSLTSAIKQDQDRLAGIVSHNVQVIIQNESSDLKYKVEREMIKIKEATKSINFHINGDTNIYINLNKVLDELSFGFTDFANWAAYLGGSFMVGWTLVAGANWWNPVGWGLAAIGGLMWLLGDSKEQKAKKQFREKLNEARHDFMWGDFSRKISDLNQQIARKQNEITNAIDNIIAQVQNVKKSTDTLLDDLNDMSNNLR